MGTFLATWEDEENNRQVQFSVEFETENSDVEILNVTPTKISFVCPETNTCVRVIGVHTEAGRALLADRFLKSGKISALKNEILARCGQLATA
jgi:hypothetical protein